MSLLEVEDLRTGYGPVPVLHGVNLRVEERETVVMLGLNGAGKTTTMLSIAGLLKPWSGRIVYDGEEIQGKDARVLVKRGLVLVPEGRHVFPGLTVQNNLRMGAWSKRHDSKGYKRSLELSYEVFPRLAERRGQLAGTLSGGEQQMLAIARGMMASPRLLLIDEASLGLSPKLAQQVFEAARRINDEGVTVFMVEQNVGVLSFANHGFVMEKGRIVQQGTGADLLEQGNLQEAYLGAPA